MLDNVILTSSFELGAHFASHKKALVANSNSLLGQLVNLSGTFVGQDTSTMSPESFTPEFIAGMAESLSAGSTGTLENPSLHDNAIGSAIDTLATTVSAHISIARSVVKPNVIEFINEFAEYSAKNALLNPAEGFNIVQKELPSIFEDQTFIEQFKYYEGKMAVIPKSFIDLGSSNVDLSGMMSTGSARIDKLMSEAVMEMGDDFVSKVFDAFFTYKNDTSGLNVNYSNLGQQNLYDAIYISLVLYTLSQKLYSNVPENAGDMDLANYRDHMLQVRDFAGAMINTMIKRAYFMIKNNTLVLKNDSRNKTIYVQGAVYRSFLETGGTVDMILGICSTDSGLTNLASILDSRDALTRGWSSYCSFAAISQENDKFSNTKSYLKTSFDMIMNNLSAVEKEYMSKDANYVKTASSLAYDYIESLKIPDIDNLGDIALNLMARCRFYFTAGYQILSGIDRASKVNPELDPREAALVSAINYVTDFFIDQISPVQV